MFILLLILHILVALLLVLSIMLQTGQAGGLSGAFGGGGGGGGAQSLFGGRGASDFLSKATTYLGAGFIVLSFVLAFAQAHRGGATTGRNIIRDVYDSPGQTETAAPAATAPAGAGGGELLPTETPAPAGGEGGDLMPAETSAPAGDTPAPAATETEPSGN